MHELWKYALPTLAAFLAGVANAFAGGGSFLTFPALVFAGIPPIVANASSTVALLPGTLASAVAYREDWRDFPGVRFSAALVISVIGGLTGALVLLFTPQQAFSAVIPWLLSLATIAFAFGPRLASLLARNATLRPGVFLCAQFMIAIYGGYFGGAVGLIMLGVWSVFGVRDIAMMNSNRTLLGSTMNAAAVVAFVIAGKVWWPGTALMVIAAVIGGYFGARAFRRLDPRHMRVAITIVGAAVSIAFFLRRS
jgi:uncharacterized membrane protein YfcA